MERSRELRGVMLGLYHDWSAQTELMFRDVIAPDDGVVAIGTDPNEWWEGGRSVAAIFDLQNQELGAIAVTPGRLHAFVNGDVGWVSDDPIFSLADLNIEMAARLTAVFERRCREWKIVQWHLSLPQAQEVLGLELTTSLGAIAEWAAEEQPDLSPSTSAEGTVTILFTDIEGSTALNESLGDERWSQLVKEHDRYMRELVAAHDGTTVQRMGDGFMLAFPSAKRGVSCAIAMQQGLASEKGFRVRIGAHTGEPIREAGQFYGRDVAYAARVGAAAQGGEILVSELVARLCAGSTYTFDGPRPLEFKGFEGTQPVFAVRWDLKR